MSTFARRVVSTVFSRRTLAVAAGGGAAVTVGGYWYLNSGPAYPPTSLETRRAPPPWTPPSREQMFERLQASSVAPETDEYDLLIIGGGATGAGVAVDAISRGLKVALVERDDFSAGTSSKSTKLVHGGVRYLQKAVFELDYEQYKLVKEALHERRIFLQTAPYLSAMLPIMLPIYKYWQVPYYWAGCKMYDLVAGEENMETSYLMSKGKALEAFPMLKGDGLVGALVYYDGQHNDSRMNMALIMTAVKMGATIVNHAEVTDLHKSAETGKLNGATVKDNITGNILNVRAKGIINATGPFADEIMKKDDAEHKDIVQPSAGIHITLPDYYSPRKMGMLDPATSDGRVIFFLPWQGNTIAGTTDAAAPVEREPIAQEEEIRWVLEEVRRYLSPDIKVRRGDVLSAWSGLRPLVRNPKSASTEGLVRNHMIHVSDSGLLTIAGGKWTTYRAMAEETVDEAVKVFNLKPASGCVTDKLQLVGSHAWSPNMFIGLIQRFGLENDVARQLSENYGDRAWHVASLAQPTAESWPLHGHRISNRYPFIDAEIYYAVRNEYAQTVVDVLSRRTRLSFLNAQAAFDAIPAVVEIMSKELGWDASRIKQEKRDACVHLKSMGLEADPADLETSTDYTLPIFNSITKFFEKATEVKLRQYGRAQFQSGEVDVLRQEFEAFADQQLSIDPILERKVKNENIRKILLSLPGYQQFNENDFKYGLAEAGLEKQKALDFHEFMELCATLKEISLPPVKRVYERVKAIAPEKSGGGV